MHNKGHEHVLISRPFRVECSIAKWGFGRKLSAVPRSPLADPAQISASVDRV